MQPLRLNHKLFQLVNLCKSPSGQTNLLHVIFGLYVFLTLNLDLISSSFLFIQFKKRDRKEVLGSVMQIAGLSCCIFQMITLFARSKRLTGLFGQFQTIYDECNYEFQLFVLFNYNAKLFQAVRKTVCGGSARKGSDHMISN